MPTPSANALQFGLRHVVAATVFAALFPLAAAPAAAEGVEKQRFGDWRMMCEKPAVSTAEQCALVQSVVAEDKANVNLVVIALKTTDGKSRLLRVIAPLGILLPEGLRLTIDQTDVGRAGFVKCAPGGCIAEVLMDDKLVEQLKNGKTAVFSFHQTPNDAIGLPFTMSGFKDGWMKLP